MDNLTNLALTYAVFLIAAGSPGPATLAIMATSATMGRKAGVLFALGVVNGSIIWGILAAFGVPKEASTGYLTALLIGCAIMASLLFIDYAVLFSTPRMIAGYTRLRRKINGALAAVFGFAGIKLLTSNV